MTCDRESPPRWVVLSAMLGLAVGLSLLPRRVTVAMRSRVGMVLEPGQTAAAYLVERAEITVAAVEATRASAQEMQALRSKIETITQRNRELELQLLQTQEEQPLRQVGRWAPMERSAPLLLPRIKIARILGQDASAFLRKGRLLSLGRSDGIETGALVLEKPADLAAGTDSQLSTHHFQLLDQGQLDGMQPDYPVLEGQAILGRIEQVGLYTSTVRLVRDAEYWAAVQLAHRTPQGLQWGPQGLLEGTGGPLCRLHVDARQPVEVGDWVFSTGGEGILPRPLVYGEVVSVSLPPGSSQWEAQVRPAADPARLGKVLVLMAQLNPKRLSRVGRAQRDPRSYLSHGSRSSTHPTSSISLSRPPDPKPLTPNP